MIRGAKVKERGMRREYIPNLFTNRLPKVPLSRFKMRLVVIVNFSIWGDNLVSFFNSGLRTLVSEMVRKRSKGG